MQGIQIENNNNLTHIGGFSALSWINSLNVTSNPQLESCCMLLELAYISDNANINSNGNSCSSLLEIGLNCDNAQYCGTSSSTTYINNQDELDSLEGCIELLGHWYFMGNDYTNTNALANVESVEQSLRFNNFSGPFSLDMPSLIAVGDDFRIESSELSIINFPNKLL